MKRKKNVLQVIDSNTELLDPTPARINLHDAHAIRREMASVYRDMRDGRIEPQVGTRLAYVLDMLRKAYEASVLQDKMDAINAVPVNKQLTREELIKELEKRDMPTFMLEE